MRCSAIVFGGAAVVLGLTLATAAAPGASQPSTLTVHAFGSGTRTSLRLQPGYATVLHADRRVDTVAIGDPRLVTATAVKRGQDVYDVILQPQVAAGATNMVIWLGGLVTIWDLEIGPGLRTADVVYVITGVHAGPTAPSAADTNPRGTGLSGGASPSPGGAEPSVPASPPPWPPAAHAPVPGPSSRAPAASPVQAASGATGPGSGPGPGSVTPPTPAYDAPVTQNGAPVDARNALPSTSALEARQVIGNVTGMFEITRAPGDVLIRYQLANGGDTDLVVRPMGVLVRVNGRLVPYAMARNSSDQHHPELLPHGATETGLIDAPGGSVRSVQVILSLFPAASGDEPPDAVLPITFQPSFAGVDRLPVTTTP